MATNKHAQIRYLTLDRCFRNSGRNYTIDDLLEECNASLYEFDSNAEGIKRRQLFDDIKFMESEQGYSIELEENLKLGRKRLYRYADPNFTISSQPLNESDANQLKAALLTLSRFKGLPQFDWVDELSIRLDESFNLSRDSQNVISFEENEYLKGKEFISTLYDAIHYKRALKIEYQSFNSEEIQSLIIHPYYLKQYNNRWFLFGKNTDFENLTNLPLDRIKSIKEADIEYIESTIDFQEYFEDVIGVTIKDDKLEKIVLKVSNTTINYIKTKPLHGSQKILEKSNDFTIIELEVIPNYELESLILSYGENMTVINPLSFKERINNRICLMQKNYNN